MRIQMRRDVPIAILSFETAYPESSMNVETARVYTTLSHVKKMVEVLTSNLEVYEKEIGPIPEPIDDDAAEGGDP